MKTPYERPDFISETDGMLVQTFREIESTAADQLRECAMEIERLKHISQKLEQDNERLMEQIEDLNSRTDAM